MHQCSRVKASFRFFACPVSVAAAARRAERPRPCLQGELQEAGGGGRVEGARGETALLRREERVHVRPLRG